MKNKKLLKAIAATIICSAMGITAFSFAACNPDNGGENGGDKHVHNYVWVDGENGTHHEHCTVDGCDEPDKPAENHTFTDGECDKCHATNSIIPEYAGEAAGPVAGVHKITSQFLASSVGAGTLEEAYTNGIVTIPKGTELRNRTPLSGGYTCSVKNGTIDINVPSAGTLTIYFSSGSSSIGSAKYTLIKPNGTADTNVVINAGDKVLQTLTVEAEAAGKYVFSKAGGTVDVYEVKFEYSAESTPIREIQVTNAGTTDYLITQQVNCNGLELIAKDENGVIYPVNLANCKFDTTDYNPNITGEYSIGVTYFLSSNLDSDTKQFSATYKVKVYAVDSIELHTIGLASSKQVTLQQTYLPNGQFNTQNLTVIAKCVLGNDTITQKLKNDWYSVTSPDLTAEGVKEVGVSVNSRYTVGNKAVNANYSIAVKAKKQVTDNVVEVIVGGTGEFKTLTQAVQYLKACGYESGVNKVIKLQAGTYNEKVWIDLDNVSLVGLGEDIDDTNISYSLVEGDVDAMSGSMWALTCATVHVTGNNFKAYNIAIRNDFDYIANNGNYSGSQAAQGVALTIEGDCNVLYNCHLFGNQDTLYMKKGRTYFYETQIDGNIDFIFGGEYGLAYFEECDIVAIDREAKTSEDPQNGYVTAPQHKTATKPDYGYIFYKCNLTDDGNVNANSMALGRPWGESATVSYIECKFSDAYSQEGSDGTHKIHRWNSMSNNTPENADFSEYGSMDAEGNSIMNTAVMGGTVLETAANHTKANIFGTSNGKSGYTVAFDCDAEYAKLRILAGLDEGDLPEDTQITITFSNDATIPDGHCGTAINERYGTYLDWTGLCKFQLSKPENGIQVDATTEITFKVQGEVSLVAGYQLPVSDYLITYSDGYATVRFLKVTGTYGDFIGSIVIDKNTIPADTQKSTVTLYNGETTVGTLNVWNGATLTESELTALMSEVTAPDGQEFDAFYANAECTTPFDFTAGIAADTPVYIGWKDLPAATSTIESDVTFDVKTTATDVAAGDSKIINNMLITGGFASNGSGWSQLSNGGSLAIKIKAETVVTVTTYGGGLSNATCDDYTVATDTDGKVYTITAINDCELVISGDGAYVSTVAVSVKTIYSETTTINMGLLTETYQNGGSGKFMGVEIDTSNGGKVAPNNNDGTWAQFNAGAVLKIYVTAGASVTVTYNTYNDAAIAALDDSHITDGYVTITATGDGYIGNIVLTFA